ncbi:retrovirus-related pol polyprotein from transposon TNT 1-94 [Tanacetum coccineum]|uniref:Retrovirus-related pol polyprotein from transposon TNT 1-94 n=1 Tax=Tanacetum coccineum TaxID=301880 RepID=A0ABQ4ZAR4_9ASTR
MPTWCHMFNSMLTGNARVWFDKLPKESIDSYEDLRAAFKENYLQQTKHIKDPVEIHHIKQRNGESTENFMERYKAEVLDVEGAPKCMKISGFMHGITHPELIKRLYEKIPRSMDEISDAVTIFLTRSLPDPDGVASFPDAVFTICRGLSVAVLRLVQRFTRFDFASWQQRIRLYCQGKDNEENILKSIDEGPFKMGKFRETLAEGEEGILHLGPERDRFFTDLSPEEKDRGRFVTAVKLNRGLKESNYDQMYAYLKQHEAHANENKMMLERYNQHAIDLLALVSNISPHQVVVQNVQGRHNRGQRNYARGAVALGNGGVQNRVGNANPGQNGAVLDEEQSLFIASGQTNTFNDNVDEELVQDLALNENNIFQADQCDAFDSDVDKAPTAQTMFMANLSLADPIYDEAGSSYDSDILYEDNAVPIVQSNVSFIPKDALMMIINDMHEQTAQCVSANEQSKTINASLTAKLARYKEQVELYERRARFELSECE